VREPDDVEVAVVSLAIAEDAEVCLVLVVALQLEVLTGLAADRRCRRGHRKLAGALDLLAVDLPGGEGPGAVVAAIGLSGRSCHERSAGDNGCRAGGADEALDRGIH